MNFLMKYDTNGPQEENSFINTLNKDFMKMRKAFYEG